jgi:hypothetical protein
MATQKQRRRRAKEKRHEYELVYVDEDGVEKPVEREESAHKPAGKGAKGTASSAKKTTSGSGKPRKVAQPPSWPKVLKRGAIFAPVFFGTVMLLGGGKGTIASAAFQTVLLIAVFIPFSYFMDRVVWRQQQKRSGRGT